MAPDVPYALAQELYDAIKVDPLFEMYETDEYTWRKRATCIHLVVFLRYKWQRQREEDPTADVTTFISVWMEWAVRSCDREETEVMHDEVEHETINEDEANTRPYDLEYVCNGMKSLILGPDGTW